MHGSRVGYYYILHIITTVPVIIIPFCKSMPVVLAFFSLLVRSGRKYKKRFNINMKTKRSLCVCPGGYGIHIMHNT